MIIYRAVDFDLFKQATFPPVVAGPVPKLCWLNIADLVFDDAYQRPLGRANIAAIKKLALAFDWRNFSTVQVAPVEDGKYAVLDGQHRVHAPAARGFDKVPCQVMAMDQAKQASSFAAINGAVTNITVFNIYRASLAAGEPWALDAERLTREAGCKLMTQNTTASYKEPGEIYSIVMVRNWVEAGQGEAMKRALTLMRSSDHDSQRENWTHVRLRAFCDCFIERQRLFTAHAYDTLVAAVNELDLDAMDDRCSEIIRHKRRASLPALSKFEYLRAEIGSAIDKALPVRLAVTRGVG